MAQQSVVSAQVPGSDVSPALLPRRVERRASQLCLGAEPHTDEPPCPAHLTEATRQLLSLPG